MANVFAQFAQPVKSVQQYDDERDAREVNRLTLQDKRRTSALAEASALEATEDRNALRRIAVDAQGDPLKMVDAARKSGRPNLLMQAATWEKDYLGRRETDSKIAGEDARTAKIGFETREAKRRSAIQQVAALNSPEEAIQLLNQQVTAGAISMQAATALERMVKTDPKWQVRLVLGINDPKEMLSALQPHMQNAGGALVNTNPLAGPTGQGAPNAIPITQSPDNAATQATARRGQNMTDARSREANDLAREGQQTQIVNDPNQGIILVNKATKVATPAVGADGKPIPSENAAAATKQWGQLGEGISMARSLIPNATASGAGAMVDRAANFVGKSTGGAEAANQLKTLAGWMTANVPRMQGPQSDKDVMLYRQMAAAVGDDTIPAAQRLAALDTLEQLRDAYTGNGQKKAPPASGKPTQIKDEAGYRALPRGAIYIDPDGKTRRKQ